MNLKQKQTIEAAIEALNTWYRNEPMPYSDQTRIARWLKEALQETGTDTDQHVSKAREPIVLGVKLGRERRTEQRRKIVTTFRGGRDHRRLTAERRAAVHRYRQWTGQERRVCLCPNRHESEAHYAWDCPFSEV